ncbi:hypothetical protein SAMN05445060_3961 [Williamsia sterculiae]|uniref:Uncharacterized protein n=1 Tax=Williamsia sterculiae TaxID=1344003 RepID=A0A1N7HCL1_9NOCA|nr:hypothetical protein SAMN05445060_3961 [Williamsia sterculiae]
MTPPQKCDPEALGRGLRGHAKSFGADQLPDGFTARSPVSSVA